MRVAIHAQRGGIRDALAQQRHLRAHDADHAMARMAGWWRGRRTGRTWHSGQPSASIVHPSSSFALISETLFTFTLRAGAAITGNGRTNAQMP
jgi:hypothetical protein